MWCFAIVAVVVVLLVVDVANLGDSSRVSWLEPLVDVLVVGIRIHFLSQVAVTRGNGVGVSVDECLSYHDNAYGHVGGSL